MPEVAAPATVRVRGEQGFALMMVLFVIALVFAMVVALMGLTMANVGLNGVSERASARERAADAALEIALNQIARDPTGNLGFPPVGSKIGSDCTVGTNGEVPLGTPSPVPGPVYVSCEALEPSESPTIIGMPRVVDGRIVMDGVRVVGRTYRGDMQAWKTGFDWSTLLGTGLPVNTPNPTVIHRGNGSLGIAGDLTVKNGSVGARTDDTSGFTPLDSSIGVTGIYAQGDEGLMNTASADPSDTAAQCGVLSRPLQVPSGYGATLTAGAGARCLDAVAASQSWQSNGVSSPSPASWSVYDMATKRPNPPISNGAASAANTTTCFPEPSTGTKPFTPGYYNVDDTAALVNALKTCKSNTFWFQPGDYYFDVNRGAAVSGPDRYALAFNDNKNVVFGTRKSGAPGSCDAKQAGVTITLSPRTTIRHTAGRVSICGPNGPASTAIWQATSANVGWEPTAVTRVLPPAEWPDGDVTGANAADDGHLAKWVATCATWDDCRSTHSVTLTDLDTYVPSAPGFNEGGNPGDAPLTSVQIIVKGASSGSVEPSVSRVTAEVKVPDASTADGLRRLCTVDLGALPVSLSERVAYELLQPQSTCLGLLTSRSQLASATIVVTFSSTARCGTFGCGTNDVPRLEMDYVGVRAPWAPAGSALLVNPQWRDVTTGKNGWIAQNDQAESFLYRDCDFGLDLINPFSGNFGKSCTGGEDPGDPADDYHAPQYPGKAFFGLTNLNDKLLPDASQAGQTLKSAAVVLKGQISPRADAGRSSLWITVSFSSASGGGSCTIRFGRDGGAWPLHDDLPVYIDLNQGECANRITKPSQLYGIGAEIRISSDIVKGGFLSCNSIDCEFSIGDVNMQRKKGWGAIVDYVGISTTMVNPQVPENDEPSANNYQGPMSSMLVTSNDDPDTPNNSVRFEVQGRVEMPMADLDVHWNGPAAVTRYEKDPSTPGLEVPRDGSIVVAPIFRGAGNSALVVNGIGSSGPGQVGVLCCGVGGKPSSRKVKLIARYGETDGPIIGVAEALISDQSVDPNHPGLWAPGQRVSVLSWTLCSNHDRYDPAQKAACVPPAP